MSSREPSLSSMLAWDDVLTGGTVTSDFRGGDVVAAALVIFSREDCLDNGFLCLSLRQDAQVFALGEWCITRTLIQLHQGIWPVTTTGGAGG